MASNINPNNIDGAYPVAGQDNNSQGFRDNFTNIKTNFQFTEDEINDLQNKAVLKAALVGQTLDNNMNDALLYAARIQDFSATKVAIATTTGTVTVNYASGHYQTVSTSGNITLAFQNFPAAGTYGYLKVQINITNDAHTVTLPASVSLGITGIQGISPGTAGVSNTITFADPGLYEFGFGTDDGGSTITVFDLNRALTDFGGTDITFEDVIATGNITGGNLITSGFTSVSGNVIAGNISTSGVANIATGNITTLAGGTYTATGNVQALNLNGIVYPTAGTLSAPSIKMTAGAVLNTPQAGAIELDSNVFYATPTAGATSSQRGIIEATHVIVTPSAGRVLAQNTAAQNVFTTPAGGQLQLSGSTSYRMDAQYVISNTQSPSTAHSLSVLFALGGTLTSITYTADVTTSAGTPSGGTVTVYRSLATAATAVQVTPTGTTTNTEVIVIRLSGMVRTNAAGTFAPQVQYNANAPGGTSTVLVNSWFQMTPLGNSSLTSVGNWT